MNKYLIAFGVIVFGTVILAAALIKVPEVGESVTDLGNEHIETVVSEHEPYNSVPPTSGPHIGSIARWGVHDEPIPDEIQVHNLEDGGVLLQYDAEKISEEQLNQLKTVVEKYPTQVILAPYEGLDHLLVLTAWTRIDRLDDIDEKRIRDFINAYRGIDHHAGE